MPKITRLEWVCLVITATVLAVTLVVVSRRQPEVAQEPDNCPAGDDLQAMAQHAPSRPTAQDSDLAQSESDREFSERVRDVPRPDAVSHALAATNSVAGEAGAASNAVAGLVRAPQAFGTNEVMAALARVAAMPWGPESEQLLQATISKWAETDPSAALDYALGIESRRVRTALLNGVFASWAKTDFKGAYSWLVANRESSPDTFRLGVKPVFAAAAASSVPEAMRMAMELGAGADRLAAMGAVMGYASRAGVIPSMVSYMDSLQTVGERRSYASLLAQNWAVYAPEQAAGWALSLTDPQLKSAAMATAVSMWAGDNPTAAAAWVMTLPNAELRSQQMAQITQSWAKYDPVKAADWLLSLRPPSTSLDPAVRSLVGTIMTSSPDVAVMWAGTIADPKLRNSTIMSVARQWMKNDPQKASAYIANAPLTPAQRTSLLRTRR